MRAPNTCCHFSFNDPKACEARALPLGGAVLQEQDEVMRCRPRIFFARAVTQRVA